MISILILTRNEEVNLGDCLDSVAWSDDVVVLDSYSTDRTVEIARSHGVPVYQRLFDNFANQRNFALDDIPFKHSWQFHLDADERFSPELRDECLRASAEDSMSGYLVASKLFYMGKWLRFSGLYPSYQMRLLKRGEIRFVQHGHGQREAKALRGLGVLREAYIHHNFSKGLEEWVTKHNVYSSREAEELVAECQEKFNLWDLLDTDDPVRRRRALKRLTRYMPCRPVLRFLYMYLWRMGFLDGRLGFKYCLLMAFYEYLIVEKARVLLRRRLGEPI